MKLFNIKFNDTVSKIKNLKKNSFNLSKYLELRTRSILKHSLSLENNLEKILTILIGTSELRSNKNTSRQKSK